MNNTHDASDLTHELAERLARIGDEAEAGESVVDDGAPIPATSKVSRGRGPSVTLQIRLKEDEHAALLALAEERNLPLSTVARSLLLDAIKAKGDPEPATALLRILLARFDSVETEVHELRDKVSA